MTAHVQRRNGERPQFLPDLMGVEGMYLVRLLKIRRHLGKNLPVGDADIHGKTKALPDFILDRFGGCLRGKITFPYGGKIHKALVNAKLFDIRTDV